MSMIEHDPPSHRCHPSTSNPSDNNSRRKQILN